MERNKIHHLETLEKIDLLQNEGMYEELLDRFKQDIYKYSNEEKRTIFLLTINKIEIDFSKNNYLYIDYRLTPFVTLEESFNKLK